MNKRFFDLSYPSVMGVLNCTPDSFSDGGRFIIPGLALRQAIKMVEEGAAIIDVGGESTRPGAVAVSLQEELDRVLPVIEAIAAESAVIISIDTSKAEVMSAAVRAGAGLINDVCALQQTGALQAAVELQVPVCLMHMQGQPRSMQAQVKYTNVVQEVLNFLQERVDVCVAAGIDKNNLIIDPGFGFGKTLEHNKRLMQQLNEFVSLGLPVLVGVSRKSMVGTILGKKEVGERLFGSVALAALAVWQGAHIIRAHDVAATVDVVKTIDAIKTVK
ncbi:Dihydropteroate synthase [hydrothermal vent metagenome]|uniref:dihydropteroate synthase n=1 Tax=hydrothermal vent metagenome TaxID=652676 RepID=A0A3B0ZLJ7_9ZZZZ